MTKSNFTFAEQKQSIVDFLNKYDSCIDYNDHVVDDCFNKHVDIAEAKTFNELLDKLKHVKLFNFDKHHMFATNHSKKHPCIKIWMPTSLDKKLSNEEFEEYLKTHTFDTEYMYHSAWHNFTCRRWMNFVKFFEHYHTCDKVDKINNVVSVKNEIAFLATENNSSDYVMNCGDIDIDLFKKSKSSCDKTNSIDSVVDAYYEMIEEFKSVIDGLMIAKFHGAKYVVDAYFANERNFHFDK